MRQIRFRYFLLPLFLVLACAGAFAQANSEVTGIVTDQTGAVVAGAKITLTDPATGAVHSTESGATGLYDIPGLNPANYNLKATAKGFESYEQTGIVVNISATFRVDVKLTVGAESQTVTVAAEALAVQTDSNVLSTLISSEEITEIATQNRNFAALASLSLGVSSALPSNNTPTAAAGGSSFTISVNGLRQSHNIWLIDGGESDDRGGAGGMAIMPSQDAIAEFQMLTSNYPPDYGISSGATMSLSLKGGTSKFHGGGWEFNRNTDYDANDYFNKYNGAHNPRQSLDYNLYGYAIGGPMYIPKVYNESKQKTFFYWNEEWRNIKQGSSPNTVKTLPAGDVPTAGTDLVYQAPLFANTDRTQGAVRGIVVPDATQVPDPAFQAKLIALGLTPGQPFPGNKIPHQLFDANAVAYLNTGIIPTKNLTANGQAISDVATPLTARDDILRVDHKINDKWQLMGHYMHDSVLQAAAGPELGWTSYSYNTVTSTVSNPANSAAIKLTGQISPTLLVEGSINYDGNIINIVNSSLQAKPAGMTNSSFFTNSASQHTVIGVTGFGNPYGTSETMGAAPWHNAAQDYEPKVDLSYITGKHSLKFGFSYNRYTKNQEIFADPNGNFAFQGNASGQFTSNLDQAACAPSSAGVYPVGCVEGDGFIDMLLGVASKYDQAQNAPINHYVNQTPSAYAMDNWHVTPHLTLQLGLRYDALPHAWERSNYLSNFNPANYQTVQAPVWKSDGSMNANGPGFLSYTVSGVSSQYYLNGIGLAGQNGFPRGLVINDYKTYQPRVGFSEDLFGNGKTVLRGGFGTFFERMQGNDVYDTSTTSPFFQDPGATNVYFSNPHTSILTGSTALIPTFAQGLTSLAQNYRAPAVGQFSLGVQHELAPSVVWVVQYVGNLAWHQNVTPQINNFPLNTDMAVRKAGGNLTSYTSVGGTLVTLPTSGLGPVANNPNSFRTYPGYGGITQYQNNTNGSYNGFQTGLRVQGRWGLSGELDYTWSHEIDITSYDRQNANNGGPSNPWNFKYDKASGDLDRRQMLVGNYMYKFPFFAKDQGLTHSILGGWEISGTFTDESGVPVYPKFNGPDTIGLGGGYTNRPNVSGKMSYPKKVTGWYDATKFSTPTAAWNGGPNQGFGNAGRDAIVGPGRVDFNTSLYKTFAITERAHFDLRFESFNTFNHTEFNAIDATVNSGTGGAVTNDWGPRTLQLGGKVAF
jgi:hypothetical protein